MMDPLTGAVCNPPEIWQMTDEMLVAGEQWLPRYRAGIVDAKARLGSGELVPTHEYSGAARLHTKTVEEMETDRERARKNAAEADKAKERPAA
jgi:alpha-galactosidase